MANGNAARRLRQIEILHLSDLHFGRYHRFDPEVSPKGDPLSSRGIRSLSDSLLQDLNGFTGDTARDTANESEAANLRCPLLACITGDFAQTGSFNEFSRAEKFLSSLMSSEHFQGHGVKRAFIVPGNHDVSYEKADIGERWQQYVSFHNRLYKDSVSIDRPWELDKLHDCIDDLGALILCVNSAIYVQKDNPDQDRGQIDEDQIANIETMLKRIPKKRRESSIRVALIHHHPILVPPLAESGRNYDAVQRSGQLLNLLHEFGFHLLLHGHKHLPLTFPDDLRNAFEVTKDHPMLVVAGGSAGSTGIPDYGLNSYNRITIKWHQEAGQTRIRVITRGLVTNDSKTGRRMITKNWYWRDLRQDDRTFSLSEFSVKPLLSMATIRMFDRTDLRKREPARKLQYKNTRRNLPVVEVRPSLQSDQAYEATFWLVAHKPEYPGYESPSEVVWSAGEKFPVITVRKKDDPRFSATFDYWGSMLVQAELRFKDGSSEYAYVYAPVPGDSDTGK